jgi:Na+/glutamate symporter
LWKIAKASKRNIPLDLVLLCPSSVLPKERKMTYLIWLLRIIHIVAGVFWVGGTLFMTFFVGPAIGATGEAGQKFVGHLMNNLKLSNRMSAAAGMTILAGFILFGLDARAGEAWLRSSFATGLGIGAGFAILGLIFGIMIGRSIKAMAQLGAQMQGKPSPNQLTQMQSIQKQQATYSRISAASLILATIFMAIARYL